MSTLSIFHLLSHISLDKHCSDFYLLFEIELESSGTYIDTHLAYIFIFAEVFNIDFRSSPEEHNDERPNESLKQR